MIIKQFIFYQIIPYNKNQYFAGLHPALLMSPLWGLQDSNGTRYLEIRYNDLNPSWIKFYVFNVRKPIVSSEGALS